MQGGNTFWVSYAESGQNAEEATIPMPSPTHTRVDHRDRV
jgi:hypothetical protein